MRVVVVTGATGATGRATCAALLARGEQVVAVGRDAASLESLRAELGSALDGQPGGGTAGRLDTRVCDLLDGDAVQALAREVVADHGHVDALFHLVGGWRGGDRFTDSTDDDWRWLSGNLVDTLRHTTLALHDHLLASGRGRVAIVSAAAAQAPTAGNAAYASAKAAAETWLGALADSFGSEGATPRLGRGHRCGEVDRDGSHGDQPGERSPSGSPGCSTEIPQPSTARASSCRRHSSPELRTRARTTE